MFTRPFLPYFKRNVMIHVFNYRDKNYIYDVGSGSLHECDKPTAEYLKAKEGDGVDVTYLTDAQIQEILSDVEGLKEQGLLYKEEVSVYPRKSSEVKALCIHICHDCNFRCRYCFADEGAYHAKREAMSAAARAKSQRWSSDAIVEQWVELIESL